MPKPINISASRGAAILGLSKWTTPTKIWLEIMESREPGFCEKNNYEFPEYEENAAMRWGKAFESAIIELAESKRNDEISAREMLWSNYDHNFITCHIDGRYGNIKCGPEQVLHEGKTTSLFSFNDNFGEPGTDRVPVEYAIQTQHQMICTCAKKVILSVLVFPRRVDEWEEMGYYPYEYQLHPKWWEIRKKNDKDEISLRIDPFDWASVLNQQGYFHQYEINANPDLQKLMIEAYTEWWERHVIGKTPPEPKTYDDIKLLCRAPVGTIIATEEIESLIAERKQINAEIGTGGILKERTNIIRVQILDFMSKAGMVEDDESKDKWILRARNGDKLATYGKNKNGELYFR